MAKHLTTSETHIVPRLLCPNNTSKGFYCRIRAALMMNLVPATFLSVQTKLCLLGTLLPTYLEMSAFPPVSFQRHLSFSFIPPFTFCFLMSYYADCFLITIKAGFPTCVYENLQKFIWEKKDKLDKPLTKSFLESLKTLIFTSPFVMFLWPQRDFEFLFYFSHLVSVFPFQLLTSVLCYEPIFSFFLLCFISPLYLYCLALFWHSVWIFSLLFHAALFFFTFYLDEYT